MTRKLFYEFPSDCVFRAKVLRCRQVDSNEWAVTLDQTAFYPTGGGQPHDGGKLGGMEVLGVEEQGSEVLHYVGAALHPGARVQGEVDWDRRLDHRQAHTGQHLPRRF